MDGFLLDLGRVLELRRAVAAAKFGAAAPVRAFAAEDVAAVARVARRQLVFAIEQVRLAVVPVLAAVRYWQCLLISCLWTGTQSKLHEATGICGRYPLLGSCAPPT